MARAVVKGCSSTIGGRRVREPANSTAPIGESRSGPRQPPTPGPAAPASRSIDELSSTYWFEMLQLQVVLADYTAQTSRTNLLTSASRCSDAGAPP